MNLPVSVGLAVVVAIAVAVLAVRHRGVVLDRSRAFLLARTHASNLAVLRIVLFGLLAFLSWGAWRTGGPVAFGYLPETLRFPPWGTGWLVDRGLADPVLTPGAIRAGLLVLAVSSSAAAVGIATRVTATVAAVAALVVLGVPQLFGKVNHSHHLVWFAALLAASPSGDALSVDALLRRRRRRDDGGPVPSRTSRAYGFPLRVTWLLIGFIYLFPGLHKYLEHGLKWALSDNLANRVLVHHAAVGRDVPAYLETLEPVLPVLALAAMVLEIAFVFLLFSRRLRPVAVVAMLAFHAGTRLLLGIWFFHLVAMYVVFVDWHGLATRLRGRSAHGTPTPVEPSGPDRPRTATVVVAAVLVVGVGLAGVRGIVGGWPFAAYPTFSNLQEPTTFGVEIEVSWRDGRPDEDVTIAELVPWMEASRVGGLTGAVLGAPDRERRLTGFWELLERGTDLDDPSEVRELRFYRVIRDLRQPEEPPRRELVQTVRPS